METNTNKRLAGLERSKARAKLRTTQRFEQQRIEKEAIAEEARQVAEAIIVKKTINKSVPVKPSTVNSKEG